MTETQRTVVITGGAGAIGRVVGAHFARVGDVVHLLDLAPGVIESADEIGAIGHVTDATDSAAMEQTLAGISTIDALVTTVGAWPRRSIDDMTPTEWDRLLAINLTSPFLSVKYALAGLRRRGGSIVFCSSAMAFKGQADMVAYVSAKAGINGMTKALARELGPDGIRVNSVAPGLVDTAHNRELWSDAVWSSARSQRAIARDQSPDDVVGAIDFLCSEHASFITGQTLVVDGGVYMQ